MNTLQTKLEEDEPSFPTLISIICTLQISLICSFIPFFIFVTFFYIFEVWDFAEHFCSSYISSFTYLTERLRGQWYLIFYLYYKKSIKIQLKKIKGILGYELRETKTENQNNVCFVSVHQPRHFYFEVS